MSPAKKAQPALLGTAKKKLIEAKHKVERAPRDLVSLVVGGIALVAAVLSLILVVREKK